MTILSLALLFFSVILHELAHGYVARRLGDPTAELQGRLTFNPLAHVDPVGTVLLPLLTYFGGGFIFGWAKPVPVNPNYFRDPARDYVKVALAGPATNLLLVAFGVVALWALALSGTLSAVSRTPALTVLAALIQVNLVLGVFNLIPIPPLDGSKLLYLFAPEYAYRLETLGPWLLLLVLVLFGSLMTGIISFFLRLLPLP